MVIHAKEEHIPSALNSGFPAGVTGLGIYDPVGDAWLQTPAESALAQVELASARAETAETRAEHEAIARRETEEQNAQLRAELARLKAQIN